MATAQRIINRFGEMAGWNSVKVSLFGRELEGIVEVTYGMEQEKENVFGAGVSPIGRGKGNRTATFSMTLALEERLALLDSIPPGTSLLDIPPFDVPISFMYGTKVYTDVVRNVEFKNDGVETKQNDKSIAIKFDCIASHVDPNVK